MNPRFLRLITLAGALVFVAVLLTLSQRSATADEKPIKALLITGGCCHDYDNQKVIIPTGIDERTNLKVDWTVIHQGGKTTDTKIPFYENPNWAEGYDVVVHNECFAKIPDKDWADGILAPHKAGLPALVIHCAMHCYRTGDDRWFEFCGVTSHRHGPKHPFKVENLAPENPIMKDFPEWTTPEGELYYIEKVWDTATPLAQAKSEQTGEYNTCIWANEYGEKKTKVFGTTIGHHNETMMEDAYLDVLTRGFLWSIEKLDDSTFKAE